MEMNLRTYVYDRTGSPGVWFCSLEANQRLAAAIARRFFHLPYVHAKMKSSCDEAGVIRYQSVRTDADAIKAPCVFEYSPGADLPPLTADSLEFFLIERYRLYASSGGRLWRGAVFHKPYPLCQVDVAVCGEHLMTLNGFAPTGRPPDHRIMSRGVDVSVYPLERV